MSKRHLLIITVAIIALAGAAFVARSRTGASASNALITRAADNAVSDDVNVRSRALQTLSQPSQAGGPVILEPRHSVALLTLLDNLLKAPDDIASDIDEALRPDPRWDRFTTWVRPEAMGRLLRLRASHAGLASDGHEELSQWRLVNAAALPDDAIGFLTVLLEQGADDVRLAALTLAADKLGRAAEPLVARALRDDHQAVARKAWLLMSWINPTGGYSGNWRNAPDDVAAAMLLASILTSPASSSPLAQIDSDPLQRERFSSLIAALRAAADRQPQHENADARHVDSAAIIREGAPAWRVALTAASFSPQEQGEFVTQLLASSSSSQRQAGALLSGFTGVGLLQLRQAQLDEADVSVREYIGAAQAMRTVWQGASVIAPSDDASPIKQVALPADLARHTLLLADDSLISPCDAVFICMAIGEADAAFAWLNQRDLDRITTSKALPGADAALGRCLLSMADRFFPAWPIGVIEDTSDDSAAQLLAEALGAWWSLRHAQFAFNHDSRRYEPSSEAASGGPGS